MNNLVNNIAKNEYESSEFDEVISTLHDIILDSNYKRIGLAKTHEILNKKT